MEENQDPTTTTTQSSAIELQTDSIEENLVETEVPPKLVVGDSDITNNKLEDTTNIGNEVEAALITPAFTKRISTTSSAIPTTTTNTGTTTTTTIKYLTQADGKNCHACTNSIIIN